MQKCSMILVHVLGSFYRLLLAWLRPLRMLLIELELREDPGDWTPVIYNNKIIIKYNTRTIF